jgi:anti-sigma B factor antagonist
MLTVRTTKFEKIVVLCLQGKIVRGETDALRYAALSQFDASVVILDLAGVSTIDASGLGLMLELRAITELKGIEFRLKNLTKLVRQVLDITRLSSVFEIAREIEAAQTRLPYRPTITLQTAACA